MTFLAESAIGVLPLKHHEHAIDTGMRIMEVSSVLNIRMTQTFPQELCTLELWPNYHLNSHRKISRDPILRTSEWSPLAEIESIDCSRIQALLGGRE
ncbi:unnamed protein product [Dovyalis caffra]|uniref:Uncharacterized protein n=1 Tax=Dovyalis caffra TaxID=77055 RepID=A0AAV1R9X5_9ROSI|nr:unnamed protein product [Dovyalis caffra]